MHHLPVQANISTYGWRCVNRTTSVACSEVSLWIMYVLLRFQTQAFDAYISSFQQLTSFI
jgi:hypothetical protein